MAEIASNRKPTLWAIFYFFAALGAAGAAFFGAAVGVSTTLSSTTTPHVAGIQVEQVLGRQVRTRKVLGLQVTGSQVLGAQVLGRQVRTRQVLGLQVLGAQVTGAHVEQVLTPRWWPPKAFASAGLPIRAKPKTATKTMMPIKNERFIRKSSKKKQVS